MLSRAARILKILLLTALAVLFIIFAAGNHASVTLSLFPLPYDIELPLFLMAILCFGMGALVAGIAMSIRTHHEHRQSVAERQRAAALEEELKSVRASYTGSLPGPQG